MGLQNIRPTVTDNAEKNEIKFNKVKLNDILKNDTINLLYYQNYIVVSNKNEYAVFEYDDNFLFSLNDKKIRVYDSKEFYHINPELNIVFDCTLAAYLLNPSASSYNLTRLFDEYKVPDISVSNIDAENVGIQFAILCDTLYREIEDKEQMHLLNEIEIPLAKVLADMENAGFMIDVDGIREYDKQLEQKIEELKGLIFSLVGYEFNLNSPIQLGVALFEKLELPTGKKTKKGYSTSAEVLENLRDKHPAVNYLLEYRQLSKLKSTYCDGLLKAVCGDNRIYSTFNQTETRTGRISSTEPNLQNIPVKTQYGSLFRQYFVAPEGKVLCDADYSQIELRVLAHIADDKAMKEAFNNDIDIHRLTASTAFSVPVDEVTPSMRSAAKAVNFGIVYGIGAFSLAKDIKVSFGEAKQYIDNYMSTYTGVAEYMKKVVEDATESGYVKTLFNRRRYVSELKASNAIQRGFGERIARNAPIQGTAADIIKIAMIRVYKRLKAELPTARLILQVHDELIVEADVTDAQKASMILKEEMEGAFNLSVPLTADVNVGTTWLEAKG